MSEPKTETVKRMAAATQELRMRNEMFSPEIVCARVADSMVEEKDAKYAELVAAAKAMPYSDHPLMSDWTPARLRVLAALDALEAS